MHRMLAYCGISCFECPVYMASRADDHDERLRIARLWSKLYNMNLQPHDINCDGCKSSGMRLFEHCRKCEIRACARGKNHESCAYCAGYPCASLYYFLSEQPTLDAKCNLEELRSNTYTI